MAKLLSTPDGHDCHAELGLLLDSLKFNRTARPGSIAECSCKRQWELKDDQRDGLYWAWSPLPVADVPTGDRS